MKKICRQAILTFCVAYGLIALVSVFEYPTLAYIMMLGVLFALTTFLILAGVALTYVFLAKRNDESGSTTKSD